MKFLRSIGLAALLMVGASSAFADIYVSTTTEKGSVRSAIGFGTGDAINAISRAIPSCPTMSVTFFQATAAQVTLYEADPDDNAFGDLTTSVIAYTATSTSSHTFRPGKQFVRFKVVQAETSGSSVAVVNCINEVADSDVLWEGFFKSNAGLNAAISSATCVKLTSPYAAGGVTDVIDTIVNCGLQEASAPWAASDVLITGINSLNVNAAGTANRGCAVCISSDQTDCDVGTRHEHPQGGDNPTGGGTFYETAFNNYYPKGSVLSLMVGQGSECASPDAGPTCYCSGAAHEFWAQIKGKVYN